MCVCVKIALYMWICMCELNVWGERMIILAHVWRTATSIFNIILYIEWFLLVFTHLGEYTDHTPLYNIYISANKFVLSSFEEILHQPTNLSCLRLRKYIYNILYIKLTWHCPHHFLYIFFLTPRVPRPFHRRVIFLRRVISRRVK